MAYPLRNVEKFLMDLSNQSLSSSILTAVTPKNLGEIVLRAQQASVDGILPGWVVEDLLPNPLFPIFELVVLHDPEHTSMGLADLRNAGLNR